MIMLSNITNLQQLWKYVDRITKQNFPDNPYKPILAAGKEYKPKLMIVFINPTSRNQSSTKEWNGIRFPFIGCKRPWKEFAQAGFIDEDLYEEIKNTKQWNYKFAEKVRENLEKHHIFLTNIVKNTSHGAQLPKAKEISLYLEIFKKEIELVQPKYIVASGLIPINALLKEKIKLSENYDKMIKTGKVQSYSLQINNKRYNVIPCHYPIGRGNPKKAVAILRAIKSL